MVGSLKSRESRDYAAGSIRTSSLVAPSLGAYGQDSFTGAGLSRAVERDPVSSSGASHSGPGGRNPAREANERSRWELRLSFGQLIVFWSIICGSLLMTFLFGLYAGREQGVQAALDGHSNEAVRLPVMNAAPMPEQTAMVEAPINAAPPQSGVNAAAAVPVTPPPSADTLPPDLARIDIPAPPVGSAAAASAKLAAEPAAELPVALPQKAEPAPKAEIKAPKEDQPTVKPDKKAEKVDLPKGVRTGPVGPGWYLQVAAARTGQEAAGIAKKLQASGLKPMIETAQVDGSAYYRIVLGPYPSRDGAMAARKAAIASKAAKGEPFPKQIK